MELEVKKCTGKELVFTLGGVSTVLANALRRTAMSQVPVFGIDKVTTYENDSALFDEYIANRIGFVPIETPSGYTEKDVVLFSLDKDGPGTVFSKSLKSSDAKVSVANADIPIMKLGEGQHLRLEAKARLGKGKEHARFQPCVITYEMDRKEKGTFHFAVESFGQMKAKEIVVNAAEIIAERLKELQSQLKGAGKE